MFTNKISVVISSYNASSTLGAALDGLAQQDIGKDNFEVIVVDDGSTDDTQQFLATYKKRGTLDLVVVYQKNGGPGIARNAGIQKASGVILAFTDADCVCDSNRLSVIYHALIQENKQFVSGAVYSHDTIIFPWKMAPVGHRGVTANLAIKRDILPIDYHFFSTGFEGMVGDDIDFVARMEARGIHLIHLEEMRVLHPANILTFERFLIRRKGRKNEVALCKKYGTTKMARCFSPIFRPYVLGRISLFTIGTVSSLLGVLLSLYYLGVANTLIILSISVLIFLSYGYKFMIIYQPKDTNITLRERVKTLFYLILTIPLFFIARVRGMIQFGYFML